MGVAGHVTLSGTVCAPENGSNLKHMCLSNNERRWQTKQEKMIKAQNRARSHASNHLSMTKLDAPCDYK